MTAASVSSAGRRSEVFSAGVEPLYQVKLLSALRSGDPGAIHPFLAEIGREQSRRTSTSTSSAPPDEAATLAPTALHLAIRCASLETVALLLNQRAISPNLVHPPGSGTTALHLAASLARADVVRLLLDQDGIDDTLRDAQGKTALDVARGKDSIRAIHDSRAFLTASYRSLLRTYIHSSLPPADTAPPAPPPALAALLASPRARLVDLSYLDDASGLPLLHAAAQRKDLRLIELAVRAGADVFVRDRRGRVVSDAAGKDERVRAFLRQFTNHDTTLLESASAPVLAEPPTLKGYLNKYTNVAKGYNTRWFVLHDGILSYYRHQDDEAVASRGSIAMKSAVLRADDKTRFEVHSSPARAGASVQKWFIKANHPVEASRWTQAIGRSIEWHRRKDAEQDRTSRRSAESERSTHSKGSGSGSASAKASILSRARTISTFPSRNGSMSILSGVSGRASTRGHKTEESMESGMDTDAEGESVHKIADREREKNEEGEREKNAGGETDDGSGGEDGEGRDPPFGEAFALQGNASVAQLELTLQLLTGVPLPREAREAITAAEGMLKEYVSMAGTREEWWRKALEGERRRQRVWEESLKAVVREGEDMERELKTRSRRRSRMVDEFGVAVGGAGSRFSLQEPGGTIKARRAPEGLPIAEEGGPLATPTPTMETAKPTFAPVPALDGLPPSTAGLSLGGLPTPTMGSRFSLKSPPAYDSDGADTDEEDEFFDAIEAGTLPNLVVSTELAKHAPAEHTDKLDLLHREQYVGYAHPRERLLLDTDNRPSTSLWAVLKGSIGKDLTKISFPVYFNEPTSMLQRMAEDMEFSECLDAAVSERDAHRRIAFVAAFAMSNYSSTIGRIAKPFNPMLSETFEYVRLDKEYRYFSEQVSHHPPISACWAESPRWQYFGEVDAQNKFMGKSFEIRPTGVAHAELLIPAEWGPGYPKAQGPFAEGKVLEHYSWKKVTTNVSGFIMASPTIDHYGEMVITNHRTGDQCVLTFKPRGWRGKDAFEIAGHVKDKSGRVTYELAGRWNSQLVARRVGADEGYLSPDVSVSGPASPNRSTEYILLWRNSEKPKAPFNLTPFAMTLNDCPKDTLRPFLPPTDCRMRPDQRAFEEGRYTRANDLKTMQEERQRATRKAREEGRVAAHRPRWFAAHTDGDTGERVWTPARSEGKIAYWAEREKVWRAGGSVPWEDVEPIFVEDEEAV